MNVSHNIANLKNALTQYQQLSGLNTKEVLWKQGSKLAREIHYSLKNLAPDRGSLKGALMSRLRSGKGIRIRESIREAVTQKWAGKFREDQAKQEDKFWGESAPGKLHWKWRLQQKLVGAEIGMRVRGVGIMGYTTRYSMNAAQQQKAVSKYGYLLSDLGIRVNRDAGYARLTWPSEHDEQKRITEGLLRPRPSAAVIQAIDAVRADIMVYVARKQKELVTKAVRQMVKR